MKTLAEQWDNGVASDLFWEELHHQDDIYLSTFASLPWLVDLSPSEGAAFEKTYLFLSHVIHCACTKGGTGCDGTGPRGKYRGLSTNIADHQHSWIPQTEWLTIEDQPILATLEQWFSDNHARMAERCLSLLGSDPMISAYAIEGFATANGSSRVAWSAQMFAAGESIDFIAEEFGAYDERDTLAVAKLYPHLRARNPALASFMVDFPGCTFDPDDPGQDSLASSQS
ncbi:MAG: hypothetical protein KDK08_03375 [Rhizobiaceae bacterium]|nr:hypothetical protein [Rhizobiaceae bacterium]